MMTKSQLKLHPKRRQDVWAAVVLLILLGLTYSNGLRGNFLVDDYALFHNRYVQDAALIGQHFIHPASNLQYRPLTYALLSIFLQWFKSDPFGYHCVNLGLFYLSCFLVYTLVK